MEGHTITRGQLERRFNHHPPPTPDVGEKHSEVRAVLLNAAEQIVELTGPSSREQSTAIARLEEAMMWANADIARKGADAKAAHSL